MNIFDIHSAVLADYRGFIRSFLRKKRGDVRGERAWKFLEF